MSGFRFKITARPPAKIKPAIFMHEPAVTEPIGLVQGKNPGSKEEWRVAQALYKLGHEFIYQHDVFGGRVAGGQVIDFWVTDTYLPTPIYMNGRAWHNNKNKAADDYKVSKLKRIYWGRIREPVIIWDTEATSISSAIAVLRRKL